MLRWSRALPTWRIFDVRPPTAMRIPVIKGIIKRRLLVNFRADPALVQRILPHPFRPKLHRGYAIAGICLIRLEGIRPAGFPSPLGLSSENAAHRFAVEWSDPAGIEREGVFIPRRDTGSLISHLAGGRLVPGEHHSAKFAIAEADGHIALSMQSRDGAVSVQVVGDESDSLPTSSRFSSLAEASTFFAGGSLGYSVTRDGNRMDGLLLRTLDWRVRALEVTAVRSSYFEDEQRFPNGSVTFDHALVMRDILHEWHAAEDLFAVPRSA